MIEILFEPFTYDYMTKAIWVSALVGGACAFLSAYLIMKGWSLMGDALAHSVVPGVAVAYMFKFSYAIGAFVTGALAAIGMSFIRQKTKLREDAVIGLVFTSFFALGLLIVSLNPTSVDVQSIILGNILAISDEDIIQVVLITVISIIIMAIKWKDLMVVFFDEAHAQVVGMSAKWLKVLFFTLLSACTVAALQTVGACLVIAMVITPGATAYLLTDRFGKLVIISIVFGVLSCAIGAYISYFIDATPGGVIVVLQTIIFLIAFFLAPKHGYFATQRKILSEGK